MTFVVVHTPHTGTMDILMTIIMKLLKKKKEKHGSKRNEYIC